MKRYYSYTSLLNVPKLKALLSFGVKGYLAEIGWFKAFETKSAIDGSGSPIPWVTYSFIDFIKDRISREHDVFEFGSGNSTLFYAKHAGRVVSVEHDREWFAKIGRTKATNSEIIYQALETNGEYCRAAVNHQGHFDIIIVDGRDRNNCVRQSVNALKPSGVIVLDDSERPDYAESIKFLVDRGFKHIAFSGISPGLFYRKSTSVFYRTQNCLGI